MKNKILFISHFLVLIVAIGMFPKFTAAQYSFSVESPKALNDFPVANFDNAERQVFELVNRERQKRGLNDLEWDKNLARLARNYSEQMADENFFGHYDRNGATVMDRARAMRIKDWSRIGENLFECIGERNFMPVSVQQWMKSSGHRRNILDSKWTMSGIGIAESRDGKIYITQVFIEN